MKTRIVLSTFLILGIPVREKFQLQITLPPSKAANITYIFKENESPTDAKARICKEIIDRTSAQTALSHQDDIEHTVAALELVMCTTGFDIGRDYEQVQSSIKLYRQDQKK